ncbi:MAG: cell division protein FtsI (penicillin-binding protein 3) [Phenylobacterium sp.]|jgi:cell division protein FtsI (penicillin-binding protein 3)
MTKPLSKPRSKNKAKTTTPALTNWRFMLVLGCIMTIFIAIGSRAAYLQVIHSEDLNRRNDSSTIRNKSEDVLRGMILDRNGIELAVSVSVQAIWADPKIINQTSIKSQLAVSNDKRWMALADVLHIKREKLFARVSNPAKRFVYLMRQVEPAMADYVKKLKIPGVYLRKESKRYYPNGEISAHLVGFTNLDAQGIDGIEKLYNKQLVGTSGSRKVRKDAKGREVEVLEEVAPVAGQTLALSIDQRIQAIAYKAVKSAVTSFSATSGSAVVVDVKTGEVLALVNSPSYNPNNRRGVSAHRFRNRAVTDVFEPGSILKPIAAISALEFGSYKATDEINTSPGWMRVSGSRVEDSRNYGKLDMSGILQHSSNVGITKLALSMPKEHFLETFYKLGFGSPTGLSLVGERAGVFGNRTRWSDFEIATLSFGYGLSVTTVQLARMYATLGNEGVSQYLSILKRDESTSHETGERVIQASTAKQVMLMLESVLAEGGTGTKAAVAGYRIAGKTGTSRMASGGSYGSDYVGSFGGVGPVSDPKIAVVVLIVDPAGDYFYGNDVAGPAFSTIMGSALQLLNVPPDADDMRNKRIIAANRRLANG